MLTDRRSGVIADLRAAALRVTSSRVAVLEALEANSHATVETLTAHVRRGLRTVSKQGVYDVLEVLVASGLARRIKPAGSASRYETRTADNHHHLVCRSCGAVADVDCVVGTAPCMAPSAALGFVIDETEVVFWGRCANCQTNPNKEEITT